MPTEAYVRTLLARPELALVPESCAAEIALHEGLVAAPLAPVQREQLAAVRTTRCFCAFATAFWLGARWRPITCG